jgi:hypothetical protein
VDPVVLRRFLPLVLLLFLGCASHYGRFSGIERDLARDDYASAEAQLEKMGFKAQSKDYLLYLLNKGLILHYAGRWQDSNHYFEQAEQKMDEIYRNLLGHAAALAINDYLLPYQGEDYEKVIVNYYRALNYVYLGQLDEALVECRKVDHKLTVLNDSYDPKNIYREDAFLHYLSALIYEGRGELNDAFIDYRKAHEIYRADFLPNYGLAPPSALAADLLRTSSVLGFEAEFDEYRSSFPSADWVWEEERRKTGEVVVIVESGEIGEKRERQMGADFPGYSVRVAVPWLPRERTRAWPASLAVGDTVVEFAKVEDLSAVAVKNLQDKSGRIWARAVARAAAKYAIAKAGEEIAEKAEKKKGEDSLSPKVVRGILNFLGVVTERADTRGWNLLPGEILMARVSLPPGVYDLQVGFNARRGKEIPPRTFRQVRVEAGRKVFLSARVL